MKKSQKGFCTPDKKGLKWRKVKVKILNLKAQFLTLLSYFSMDEAQGPYSPVHGDHPSSLGGHEIHAPNMTITLILESRHPRYFFNCI